MKRKTMPILVASLVLVLLFSGCDLFMKLAFDDIKGEWDFPDANVKGTPAEALHVSVMGDSEEDMMLDIRYERNGGANTYLAACGGSLEGKTFTGIYTAWSEAGEVDTEESITVTIELKDDKLSIECEGEGNLDGVVMEGGELVS